MKDQLFAVITGDVVNSSRFAGSERQKLIDALKFSFAKVDELIGKDAIAYPFEIFRGDSFQGVCRLPKEALTAALIVRAAIRKSFTTTIKNAVDARIAIGIGTISHLPQNSGGEGDGPAFRNSGPQLDKMIKHARMLIITTPREEVNQELNVECALLDTVIARWSKEQAEVVLEFFGGKTQEEIANHFQISQPAIKKRLDSAGVFEIDLMQQRFKNIISEIITPQGYKSQL
jgi:hypothetical protein